MVGRPRTVSIVVIAVVASAIVLAACARESSSDAPPGVGEVFAGKALAVCQAALEQKQAWRQFPFQTFNPTQPDPSKFPDVAVWLKEEVALTFATWLADLQALGEPPGGQEAWGDVLAAVENIVQLNEEQIAAAEGGDADAFVDATNGLSGTQVELVRATEAAGVPACADVHT